MAYKVTLKSAGDDGTNLYTEMEITDGNKTFPLIRPVFPTGTTAATVKNYMQVIANNAPTLAADIGALVNTSVTGV